MKHTTAHFQTGPTRRLLAASVAALMLALSAWPDRPAQAQEYPNRPVRIIAPFGAGGGGDVSLRMLSGLLAKNLGQSVIVDNKPGANGIIGVQEALKGAADGYTLFYGSTTTLAANASTLKKVPYDSIKDFTSISLVSWIPFMLVVNAAAPSTSVTQLITQAKAAAQPLSFASANDSGLVAGNQFARAAGVQLLNVPYKASPAALTDLVGGQLAMMFVDVATGLPLVSAGKLRALGVTTAVRSALLPNTPAIAETLPGYELIGWTAMSAPAGTPQNVIRRVASEIEKILAQPEVREAFVKAGFEPRTLNPEATDAFVRAERDKWAQRVKAAGIEPQ